MLDCVREETPDAAENVGQSSVTEAQCLVLRATLYTVLGFPPVHIYPTLENLDVQNMEYLK